MSTVKRSLNVGVVGLGNMGLPIARNLAFKARSAMYLQLHSRTLSKARRICDDMSVDGATCAMRLHDKYSTVTKWCDVILLTLANPAAARAVLLEDAEALIPNARPGQIIVDHTTVDMELSRLCAVEAARRGAQFLDAPMSGSPRAAFNNQLVLMVGGAGESMQRMLPIFRMYADQIHHMGESGSGTATKLLSQSLVASHNAAAAEAMTMANRLGIEDQQKLVQVLDASWGSSTMLRRNAPTMQTLIRDAERLPPASGASIGRLLDDLALLDASLPRIATEETPLSSSPPHDPLQPDEDRPQGEEERFPVLDASLRMLGAAQEAGMGDRDVSAVVNYIQAAAAMEEEEGIRNTPRRLSLGAFTNASAASAAGAAPADHNSNGVGKKEKETKIESPEFTMEDFY